MLEELQKLWELLAQVLPQWVLNAADWLATYWPKG